MAANDGPVDENTQLRTLVDLLQQANETARVRMAVLIEESSQRAMEVERQKLEVRRSSERAMFLAERLAAVETEREYLRGHLREAWAEIEALRDALSRVRGSAGMRAIESLKRLPLVYHAYLRAKRSLRRG